MCLHCRQYSPSRRCWLQARGRLVAYPHPSGPSTRRLGQLAPARQAGAVARPRQRGLALLHLRQGHSPPPPARPPLATGGGRTGSKRGAWRSSGQSGIRGKPSRQVGPRGSPPPRSPDHWMPTHAARCGCARPSPSMHRAPRRRRRVPRRCCRRLRRWPCDRGARGSRAVPAALPLHLSHRHHRPRLRRLADLAWPPLASLRHLRRDAPPGADARRRRRRWRGPIGGGGGRGGATTVLHAPSRRTSRARGSGRREEAPRTRPRRRETAAGRRAHRRPRRRGRRHAEDQGRGDGEDHNAEHRQCPATPAQPARLGRAPTRPKLTGR